MRGKLITLYLSIVAISLLAIYWKMDHDFFGEKIAANETQSRSQLASLTRATEAQLGGLTPILDLAMPTLLDSKKDTYGSDQVFGRFHMIAKVVGAGLGVRLDNVFMLEKSPVHLWGPTYAIAALRNASSANSDSDAGLAHLWTVLDPNRKAWFLYESISTVTGEHYAALLPADFLQGLLDGQKGQESSFSVVNTDAQVVAHTTAEYVGQLLSHDPLVQLLQTSGHTSGSALVDGMQGERVQGLYEKVNGTNLFATISTPVRVLMASRGHLKTRFLYLGLGLGLVGVCFILLFSENSQADPLGLAELARTGTVLPPAPIMSSPIAVPDAPRMPGVAHPQPPAPPVREVVKSPDLAPQVEKFETLFGENKMAGAMNMIDTLDESPPPAPVIKTQAPHAPQAPEAPLKAPTKSAAVKTPPPVKVEAAPPPPPWAGVNKPNIDLPEKVSKLDEFVVKIRKPRSPSSEAP